MEHRIDATNEKLGRVASKAAALLAGKDLVSFARNKMPTEKVFIFNASKLSISDKTRSEKKHVIYSGYPGGLRKMSVEQTIAKKGYSELLRKAISGMLPKNKLRARMLINLKIND